MINQQRLAKHEFEHTEYHLKQTTEKFSFTYYVHIACLFCLRWLRARPFAQSKQADNFLYSRHLSKKVVRNKILITGWSYQSKHYLFRKTKSRQISILDVLWHILDSLSQVTYVLKLFRCIQALQETSTKKIKKGPQKINIHKNYSSSTIKLIYTEMICILATIWRLRALWANNNTWYIPD